MLLCARNAQECTKMHYCDKLFFWGEGGGGSATSLDPSTHPLGACGAYVHFVLHKFLVLSGAYVDR